MTKNPDNESQLARTVAQKLLESDQATRHFGMQVEEVGPGYARLRMKVTPVMVSGFGIAHGGAVFTLADSAFAYACNSRNQKSLALCCSINFVRMAEEGDFLTAIAREKSSRRTVGLYEITITNQKDQLVALFTGTSYITGEKLVP